MTNQDIIVHAIADGVVDKDLLLARVLSGAAAPRPVRAKGQWKSAAGWLCSACMVCFMLIGYFNGNIILRTQGGADSALAGAAAFDENAKESGLLPSQPPLPEGEFSKIDAMPSPQGAKSFASPVVKALPLAGESGQDGWVRTSQEVNVADKPPKYETYEGDLSGSSYGETTPKPEEPKPDKPKPDKPKPEKPEDGGPSNPDTGGGDNYTEVPYLHFVADSAYSAYWGYIPSNLIGFSVLPFVGYAPSEGRELGSATINYGNPSGAVKQVFSVIVQGNPEGAPLITSAAQITPALLKNLNGQPLPKDPSLNLYINIHLNIQSRQVSFESQNISYEQAAQVLRSLPALNGGIAP